MHYLEAQQTWLAEFSRRSADVEVPDQAGVAAGGALEYVQLIQSSAPAEDLGISAKGVTGSGSRGIARWTPKCL
ncbi:MAG: hypothetical protein U1U88_000906 [Lawsonella clevelandensis]